MMVELSKLRPNPFRNFRVDPIDEDNVQRLVESVNEHDFWGGPTCRKLKDGTYQIAAGHHRIEAAIRAGMKYADIHVGNFSDEQMIRIYAVENATQRGNTSTAMGGSVASAIRFIAKDLLVLGTASQFWEPVKERGHQQVDPANLGEPVITRFLKDVPGINKSSVTLALGQLKAGGEYATIIGEVQTEIEAENAEALRAAEQAQREAEEAEAAAQAAEQRRKEADEAAKAARDEAAQKRAEHERQKAEAEAKLAEKRRKEAEEQSAKFNAMRATKANAEAAAEKAAEREVTFDRNGVAPHFTNPNHLRVFQQEVEKPGIREKLAVSQQAALAEAIVKQLKDEGRELSGASIRDTITAMVIKVRSQEKQFSKKEEEELLRADMVARAKHFQAEFSRSCRGMTNAGIHLSSLRKDWPKDLPFPITGEFREAVRQTKIVVDKISKEL